MIFFTKKAILLFIFAAFHFNIYGNIENCLGNTPQDAIKSLIFNLNNVKKLSINRCFLVKKTYTYRKEKITSYEFISEYKVNQENVRVHQIPHYRNRVLVGDTVLVFNFSYHGQSEKFSFYLRKLNSKWYIVSPYWWGAPMDSDTANLAK